MSDLRARQRDLARQSIVDATAALVTERHHLDFAMKEVAERAGVSLRTVYNHFPDRADLLDALGRDFDARTREAGAPNAEDLGDVDIAAAIARNHRIFEELGGVSEALAQLPLADAGRDPDRARRTEQIVAHLTSRMPGTDPDQARAIALMLRHLLSHRSWFWLTREYGLTTEQSTAVATWAVETLLAAAATGDLPATTPPDPTTAPSRDSG